MRKTAHADPRKILPKFVHGTCYRTSTTLVGAYRHGVIYLRHLTVFVGMPVPLREDSYGRSVELTPASVLGLLQVARSRSLNDAHLAARIVLTPLNDRYRHRTNDEIK